MNREEIQFSKENQTRGNARAMSIQQLLNDPKLSKCGENKGLRFKFDEGDTIVFPKPDECFPFPKTFNGVDVLYVGAFSVKRNRFVEIPIALFRQIPATEEEQDMFFNPEIRGLNLELAEFSYDWQRIQKLCEVGAITVVKLHPLHKPVFEQVDGKWRRVPEKLAPLNIAEIQLAS